VRAGCFFSAANDIAAWILDKIKRERSARRRENKRQEMIKKKEFEKYFADESDAYYYICFVHNPAVNVKSGKWQNENRSVVTEEYINSLNSILTTYCKGSFRIGLERAKFSWAPKSVKISKELRDYLREKGLNRKGYKGFIYERDLENAIRLLINYPLDNHYQDVEIYALKSNCVIVFDHHGVTWIIHDDKDVLRSMASELQKIPVQMIVDKNLQRDL